MNRSSRFFTFAAWGFLLAIIAGIAAASSWSKYDQARRESGFPVIGTVADFQLVNQHGEDVSFDDLKGRIWVGNIVFTRCPGPCAVMSARMSELQRSLPPEWDVRLVTLTADPAHDSPDVLTTYANGFGADHRWMFLTGEKAELYDLARKGLKLGVQENEMEDVPLDELFIHSTRFILVDGKGRVRQAYEGTDIEAPARVIKGIRALKREEGRS